MSDRTPRRQHELQLRIRKTAYLLWEAAGGHHGRSLEFWLAAEREVLASQARSEQRQDVREHASGTSEEVAGDASNRRM